MIQILQETKLKPWRNRNWITYFSYVFIEILSGVICMSGINLSFYKKSYYIWNHIGGQERCISAEYFSLLLVKTQPPSVVFICKSQKNEYVCNVFIFLVTILFRFCFLMNLLLMMYLLSYVVKISNFQAMRSSSQTSPIMYLWRGIAWHHQSESEVGSWVCCQLAGQ